MSLFIGKDNSSKSCVIITKYSASSEDIKATIPNKSNNFAVDSRRNLLFYDILSSTPSVVGTYTSNNNINGNFTYTIYRINIPSDLINTGGNTRAFMIFTNNFSSRVELPLLSSTDKAAASITVYYYGDTYIDIHSINTISNIQVVSTYLRIDGTNIFNRDNSNSISIGNSKFIVEGVNYFNAKYIIQGIINGVDPVVNINGSNFQLINCYESNQLTLDIYSSTGIKVYTGNKLVLDSTANYLQAFSITQTPTIVDFSIVADYIDKDIFITTLPSSYKLLAITFYPRYSINPNKSTVSIVLGDSSVTGLAYSLFPYIDGGGALKNGIFFIGFKVVNKQVYITTEYAFDGTPDDSVRDTLNMRMSYLVLSE